MNDSNPTTNLRIEGRPTAVAGRAVHFGSLVIELAPEAPTPNLQTHCVLHAQLHRHGGGFVWRQIDSAFQVIGQIAEQRSEPRTSTASASAAPIQPPAKPAAGQRTAPSSEPAAPAPQDVAAHEQPATGAATASPKPSAGAGGNVSAFQRVSRGGGCLCERGLDAVIEPDEQARVRGERGRRAEERPLRQPCDATAGRAQQRHAGQVGFGGERTGLSVRGNGGAGQGLRRRQRLRAARGTGLLARTDVERRRRRAEHRVSSRGRR